MEAIDLSRALRNIVAGMAELALIIVATIAAAWVAVKVIEWWRARHPAPAPKPRVRQTFPTPLKNRALEAANRTIKPK